MSSENLSFWQHLDVLRGVLIRCIVAIMGCGVVFFCCKDWLFRAVFWATDSSFPLWRLMPLSADEDAFHLINTELTQQFIIHIEVAMMAGLLVAFPYIVYELVRFIAPALYPSEKKAAKPAVLWACTMFYMGMALSYFVIFPITYRFLAGYHVQTEVVNMISLRSYVSTMMVLSLMMGLLFQLPILCFVLSVIGILKADVMRHFRRYAIVAILIIAAVVTPTGDAFTLSIVALPIYLLYEVSILIVSKSQRT